MTFDRVIRGGVLHASARARTIPGSVSRGSSCGRPFGGHVRSRQIRQEASKRTPETYWAPQVPKSTSGGGEIRTAVTPDDEDPDKSP